MEGRRKRGRLRWGDRVKRDLVGLGGGEWRTRPRDEGEEKGG